MPYFSSSSSFLTLFVVVSLILAQQQSSKVSALIPRACSTPNTDKFPFCNPSLDVDDRVRDLISRIQDDEVPGLLSAEPVINVTRLGVPQFDWGLMCGHGVQSRCGTKCPTSFPNPNNMGASWNMTLAYEMSGIIGLEVRALWLEAVHEIGPAVPLGTICRSPNINVNRDPRWGRNVEVPSEDPLITARFGVAWTRGIQEGKLDTNYIQTLVTIKHFAAYSFEALGNLTRHNFDAIVSKYDLANTYFPAFKSAVIEGKANGIECSYNEVNGIPSCASSFLLNDTLRNAWGFDGYVTSDQGALNDVYNAHHYVNTQLESAVVSLKAGTDLDYGVVFRDALGTALQKGLVTRDDVNAALFRTLKLRFQLGLFDPIDNQPYWNVPPSAVNTAPSQAFNLFAAQQGIVLLKNTNNLLPFPKNKKVAVVGPHFNATKDLVGNYLGQLCPAGDFSCITGVYQAIQEYNVNGGTTYAQGCTVTGSDKSGFAAAVGVASAADYVILMIGLNMDVEHEEQDRTDLTLPGVQAEFADAIIATKKPIVVVLINGGAVAIESLKSTAPAIIEAFYPGYAGSSAIASVIFGDYNPGGKLPITIYPASYIDQIKMTDMSMTTAPGRSYKYYTGTPLWPFGWGLSYSTFMIKFSSDTVPNQTMTNEYNQVITYSVLVTNNGPLAGDEVVQAYFKPKDVKVIKQLFDYQRIHLEVGESKMVEFMMNYETIKFGDDNGDIVSVPGDYPVQFTNGVDQMLTGTVTLSGSFKILEKFP